MTKLDGRIILLEVGFRASDERGAVEKPHTCENMPTMQPHPSSHSLYVNHTTKRSQKWQNAEEEAEEEAEVSAEKRKVHKKLKQEETKTTDYS